MLPNNAPTVNGLKLVEVFARGTADLTDAIEAPLAISYSGWKMGTSVARFTSVVQSASGKITAATARNITGGTGRLAGIQGVVRHVTNLDPRPGAASPGESQYEIEYSLGK
jgi:hypothetical protein